MSGCCPHLGLTLGLSQAFIRDSISNDLFLNGPNIIINMSYNQLQERNVGERAMGLGLVDMETHGVLGRRSLEIRARQGHKRCLPCGIRNEEGVLPEG